MAKVLLWLRDHVKPQDAAWFMDLWVHFVLTMDLHIQKHML